MRTRSNRSTDGRRTFPVYDGGIRLLNSLARRLCAYFEKVDETCTYRVVSTSYSSTSSDSARLERVERHRRRRANADAEIFGACDAAAIARRSH